MALTFWGSISRRVSQPLGLGETQLGCRPRALRAQLLLSPPQDAPPPHPSLFKGAAGCFPAGTQAGGSHGADTQRGEGRRAARGPWKCKGCPPSLSRAHDITHPSAPTVTEISPLNHPQGTYTPTGSLSPPEPPARATEGSSGPCVCHSGPSSNCPSSSRSFSSSERSRGMK